MFPGTYWLVILRVASVSAGLASSSASAQLQAADIEKLQNLYLSRLDTWVASRDLKTLQAQVVENCGKMMYLKDATLGQATPNALKETLDTRIDVCTKITVHRVEPQPEFSNPAVIKIVCGDMPKSEPVIARLCVKAGVTRPRS
jgi:hypothetical protein